MVFDGGRVSKDSNDVDGTSRSCGIGCGGVDKHEMIDNVRISIDFS